MIFGISVTGAHIFLQLDQYIVIYMRENSNVLKGWGVEVPYIVNELIEKCSVMVSFLNCCLDKQMQSLGAMKVWTGAPLFSLIF